MKNFTNKKAGHIDNIMAYLENNISNDLETRHLQSVGYVSRRQLYRDFYSATGHSLNEYKRKRQLSNALALIKNSEMPLVEIAYTSGFSSQQALCRAVKERIGLTPSEYKNSDIFYFFPIYSASNSNSIIVAVEQIPTTVCFRFYCQGFLNIENNAIKAMFEQIPQYKGRIFGYNGKQTENGFYYDLCLTDTNIKHLNGFIYRGIINGSATNFAVTSVKYNEKEINNSWNMLCNEWLPSSMFEASREPFFEEYLIRNKKPFKLKLYLPIEKRDNEMKITIIKKPDLRYAVVTAKGLNAEKKAAHKIIEYMYENRLKTNLIREYLVSIKNDEYTCGVRSIGDFNINDNDVLLFTTDDEHYVVLENTVIGDYNLYAEKLVDFARDNGINIEQDSIFAVYSAEANPIKPKMKMYVKARFGTI